MDDKFKNWQQQYQQCTPDIDTQLLIKQVAIAQKKERLKAYSELALGAAVSVYCIYAAVMFAQSLLATVLFALLSVVPISFSMWSFKLRQKQWQQQSVDVNQLLAIKRQHLFAQLRYWRMNAIVVCLLWLALLMLPMFDYFFANNETHWIVIVCINGLVVCATLARFFYLKRKLNKRLNDISALLGIN